MTRSPDRGANLRRLCACALLGALALILSWVESLIPLPLPLPGVKLGLANLAVLLALELCGRGWAALVLLVKAFLSSLLFAGLGALPYALCGGCLALLIMSLLRDVPGLSPVGVSVAGAAAHGLGQVLLGALLTRTPSLLLYATPLMLVGVLTGALLGFIAGKALPLMRRAL